MTELLDLSPDELLMTTRAVRKRLDFSRPVERSVILECVDIAQQAPVGSNAQHWHFVVVTDAAKREEIAKLYQQAFAGYRQTPIYASTLPTKDAAHARTQNLVADSASYLSEHLAECPVLVIPCIERRVAGVEIPAAVSLGSILPAAWSFMLAARARGLGTCWTTLHLTFEQQVAEIVGIPFGDVSQAMLTPLAYTIGTDFKPAARPDPTAITHFDTW